MKNFNSFFNQLTAMPKRLAMVLTVLFILGVGSMLGAVVSGTTYSTASSMPDGWSKDGNYNNSSYLKLTYSTNYIQTDNFCVNSFTSIKIRARKFGGPSDAQAKITVEWVVNGNATTLGTITPSSTSLTDYTISSPASITANKEGCVKISCKSASSDKGAGVSAVTITYTAGNCSGGGNTGGDSGDSGDDSGNSGDGEWVETEIANISSTDIVVVTMANSSGTYAMSNNNGTSSAPTATKVTVSGKTLSGKIADDLQWNISNSDGSLTFYPNGTTEKWLYCTGTNNGVRVGTNTAKAFTIDATSGYLKHTGTSRYIGVYNSADWRCYTSYTTDNIKNQTLKFYKKTVSTPVNAYTLTNEVSPAGYGSVSPESVEDVPEGTTTNPSDNTYTVNGTKVTATPAAATAQYTYVFSEWQNLPATVNNDATVTAVFTRTTNKYTIIWKNGDNVLETDNNVEYGVTPQYDGATPTKAATAQYTYAFTGWNPAIASVTKDQTYTAQFSQTVNKYTITWKNADGTTLKTEEVAYGTTPSYTGTTPTKAATEQYTYTHNGWTPSVVAVTGNAEYTATFAETPRTYTITLNTNGGTIKAGNVTSYKYGTGATLPTNVTKEHHQFDGWFDNSGCTGTAVTTISTTATGNKEYWAKWTELPKYTVTWSVDGNTTTEKVYSGDKATKAPTIDENNLPCDGADKFVGWTTGEYQGDDEPGTLYPTAAAIPAITGDITFYAVFADYAD